MRRTNGWRVVTTGLAAVALAAAAVASGCSDDNGFEPSTTGFGPLQAFLSASNCRSCHNAANPLYHGVFELTNVRAADSVAVTAFLNLADPQQSPLLQRLTVGTALAHPFRPFVTAAEPDAQMILAYAAAIAAASAPRELVAIPVATGPAVDGVAEGAWEAAPTLAAAARGGFAGDVTVTMRAMYTPTRVYFLLQWNDPTESVVRGPWIKTVSGWLKQPVAPANFDATRLISWRTQPANYFYEDKLAIIWNTTGSSSVAGFNETGCAVLCHVDQPGDPRPLKYTNFTGEVADMWHWKLVRTNVVHRLDDQYVYWNRSTTVNSGAGRAGDPGGSEYGSNGSSVPLFMSGNQPAPPYFLVDSAVAAAWAAAGLTIDPGNVARAFADNFAVGEHLANAITKLRPNVDRSHVEAYGVWGGGTWTLEVGRDLTTNSAGTVPPGGTATVPVDVQFVPGQRYHFGVAVFENAQIEHSWTPSVYALRFQP